MTSEHHKSAQKSDDECYCRFQTFSGLNKKQSAHAFILSVEAQLSSYNDADKCRHFINCLRGTPQLWYAKLRLESASEVETWENVKKAFLTNFGARISGSTATSKCRNCTQSATESVDEFHRRFDDESFDALPHLSERERAHHFLLNLRCEIVDMISRLFYRSSMKYTVNQVWAAARNAESILNERASAPTPTCTDTSSSTSSSTTSSSDYTRPQKRKLEATSDDQAASSQSCLEKVQCYKCRNFGHYANKCRRRQ